MKRLNKLMASAMLMAAMPVVMAAPTVDLSVTGSIVPGSCTPTLSASEMSFGKVNSADLNAEDWTTIGYREATMQVQCSAQTLFGIRAVDNRAASNAAGIAALAFGLGMTPAGEKIGHYAVRIMPAGSNMDGKPVFLTVARADGTAWSVSSSVYKDIRSNGELVGLQDQPGLDTGPVPVAQAVLALSVKADVQPASNLTLTEDVTLDGSATIEVAYL